LFLGEALIKLKLGSFAQNIAKFSIATWVSFAISLLSAPISTRIYSPDSLGRINLFYTYSSMLMSLAYLGLDQAYVRFYNELDNKKAKDSLFSFCLFISILAVLLLSFVAFIFHDKVSTEIVGEKGFRFVFLLAISATTGILSRYLNLFYRMQIDGKWYTIQAITDILFVKFSYLVSGYFNSSYQSAILVMVISRFVVIFGFYLFHRNRLNFIIDNSNRELSKDIIKFALPLVPITFLSWANSSVSQIVLKNMLGYADLGVYSVAVGLANTVNVVQAGFNAYWAPYVYSNYKSENNNFNQVHKYMIFLLLLISLIIVFCQDPIFIILGQKYRNAKIFFPFLLFSPICYTIAETTGLGINISKKTFWNLIIFSINITTNIVACLLLIPIFGVSGAAMASSISSILYLVIRTIVGEKYYKSIKSYRYLMYLLVILSSSALVNYFVYLKTLKYALFMLIFFIYAYLFRKEISSIFGALNRKA